MKRILKFGIMACLATAFIFAGCKKDSDNKYSVTLSANNPEMGVVAGAGEYDEGTEIQIMATANSGFHFEKWSDDDTNNPRTITVSKNIALIALFAAGNGGGMVNGGETDNNNNPGNNGTATGDILPKKVTKIVRTSGSGREVKTYLFDTYGRLISETETYDGKVEEVDTYTYDDNKITRTDISVYNIENGRIVSAVLEEGGRGEYIYPSTYTYTTDGYLASKVTTSKQSEDFIDESKFTVTNGNITGYENHYVESWGSSNGNKHTDDSKYNGTIVFGDKPNNLNVDITLFIVEYDLEYFSDFYGKRNKNLPTSSNETYTRTRDGEEPETYTYVYQYTYTYNGDYLTKIHLSRSSVLESYEYTYEIFYE